MINNELLKEIMFYCSANELDTTKFVNDLLKEAFMVKKYPAPNAKVTEEVVNKSEVLEKNNKEKKKNIYGE